LGAERFFPKDKFAVLVLMLGALFFIVVLWIPIVQTLAWSFTEKFMLNMSWVGLSNYRKLLQDPLFYKSIKVTFGYMLLVMPIVVVLGLVLAVLVDGIKNRTVRGLFTASYFLAYIVPLVAVGVVWRYIFEPSSMGLLNSILKSVGLKSMRWLEDPDTALYSLAIVGVWKYIGYVLVIYLAGLQTIPDVFYEAAEVDGASQLDKFFRITVPLLTPTIFFVVIMMTITTLMMFTETFVMTNQSGQLPGGPLGSTTTMVLYIWKSAFAFQKEGYASAIAVVLFALIGSITFIQARFAPGRFEY
jgi:multiple sugar transport system permease protein